MSTFYGCLLIIGIDIMRSEYKAAEIALVSGAQDYIRPLKIRLKSTKGSKSDQYQDILEYMGFSRDACSVAILVNFRVHSNLCHLCVADWGCRGHQTTPGDPGWSPCSPDCGFYFAHPRRCTVYARREYASPLRFRYGSRMEEAH